MLTLGIVSYKNPDKLRATIASIKIRTVGEWQLYIVHNPADGDGETRRVIEQAVTSDARISVCWLPRNFGYAGGVNELLRLAAGEELVAYCDNDVEIQTHGWNHRMEAVLRSDPKMGMVMTNACHRRMDNECFWGAGFCWMLRRSAVNDMALHPSDRARWYYGKNQPMVGGNYDPVTGWIGPYACDGYMDSFIGHHEEVDFQMRLRLAGYKIGCAPDVTVHHHESSTRSPESETRIHDGVVRWMNKWNNYFVGSSVDYSQGLRCEVGEGNTRYGDDALQMDAWNVSGPYLNQFFKPYLNGLNANPEVRDIPNNGPVDLIKVPRPIHRYRAGLI